MKRRMYICFSIFCFIILFFETVKAEIPVWQAGEFNDSFSEFDIPDPNVVEYTVEYTVPQNWESQIGQIDPNWGQFPVFLYSVGDHEYVPREIKINFDYPKDCSNPALKIRCIAKIMDNLTQVEPDMHFIDVFKGDIYIGSLHLKNLQLNSYNYYYFPLEYIRKGLSEKNSINIKVRSPYTIRVAFDAFYLYIDDTDTDGDGVSDSDEGEYYKDTNSLVCLPTKVYDPSDKKRILLDIEKLNEINPCFREAGFLDPNMLKLPDSLLYKRFLPYECLGFQVEDIGTQVKIVLQISFIDQMSPSFYPSVRFHTYQDTNSWSETNFELLDGNAASIPLYDGGEGDFDGKKDGIIKTKLVVSYPRTIDVDVEKRGCFINTVIR
ncbi:MAG: hypothetical protein ACMUHX_02880 [bacterium]